MARSVRDDYTTLKALLPIAQHIIEAAGAAERILNLAASGDNLAARKDQLAKEVATVLAELEEAKKARDQAVADRDEARQKYDEDQTAYAAQLNQTSATHADALADAEAASLEKMAAKEQEHAARLQGAKNMHTALVADIGDLIKKRNGLKDEIDHLVAKFR